MAKADDKRVFDADGELFFWTFFLLSMLPFFSSVGIVCYQSFMWMKYGEWLPITIDMAVDKFFRHSSLNEWLINPQSWYGLHKMISGTSLSPCLFIFSIFSAGLVFYVFALISEFFEKRNKKRREDEKTLSFKLGFWLAKSISQLFGSRTSSTRKKPS